MIQNAALCTEFKKTTQFRETYFLFFFVKRTKIVLFKDLMLGKYTFKNFFIVQKIKFFFQSFKSANNKIT